MADSFSDHVPGMAGPAENAFDVTPNDSADLSQFTRGLYLGNAGDVKVDTIGGDTVTFTSLSAGVIHPIRVARVYATGTTATNIIGVY